MAIADSRPDCRESGGADSWSSGRPPRLQEINDWHTHVLGEAHLAQPSRRSSRSGRGRRHVRRKTYLTGWKITATVGLNPRFDIRRISLTMLILESKGRLMTVFPPQYPEMQILPQFPCRASQPADTHFNGATICSLRTCWQVNDASCCRASGERRRSSQLLAT
jgi:hypothetical protein